MIRLLQGDCRETLKMLDAGSVQCCVTSPPYFGLRDYQTPPLVWGGIEHEHEWDTVKRFSESSLRESRAGFASQDRQRWLSSGFCACGAWLGSLGLEPTPELFISHLVEVFREVKRVLRDDGVLWCNLGDSYAGSGKGPSNSVQSEASQIGPSARKARGMNNLESTPSAWIPVGTGYKAKDLMLMPFRVAMALQQPYVVPTCVKSEIDRAWLAAMFDGEGTIGIRRYNSWREEKKQIYQDGFVVYSSVTNNDVELLDHCIGLTGFGRYALKQAAASTDKRGIVSRRDSYGWRLDGNDAVDVVQAIYPYLVAKRKQAMIAYTLDRINKSGRAERGNNPVSPEVQAKKVLLHDLIKRCNQREGSIDLPSWIEEPKPAIEPGWYLRSVIPWLKRNSLPESVNDRPSTSVEYVFLLAKSSKYFWDADAVRMPQAEMLRPQSERRREMRMNRGVVKAGEYGQTSKGVDGGEEPTHVMRANETGRNRRNSDWFMESWQGLMLDEQDDPLALVVNPMPFSGAHFATFPPKLVEPMVKASTSEKGQCPECRAPWVRTTEKADTGRTQKMADGWDTGAGGHGTVHRNGREHGESGIPVLMSRTTGWRPSCAHTDATPVPQVVLDCFGGAGTVGLVADRLERDAILCELKESYADMGADRIIGDNPMFTELAAD